jgi:hypothetical protein
MVTITDPATAKATNAHRASSLLSLSWLAHSTTLITCFMIGMFLVQLRDVMETTWKQQQQHHHPHSQQDSSKSSIRTASSEPSFSSSSSRTSPSSSSSLRPPSTAASQCRLYLAPSAIPNGGLGIFVTEGVPAGTSVAFPDVCIYVTDCADRVIEQLRSHSYGRGTFFGQFEGSNSRAACEGLATLMNTMVRVYYGGR